MSLRRYVACDLGAESGRVMLGTLADGRLSLEEIHRFPNRPVSVRGSLRWDVLGLFDELKTGLRRAGARGLPVASVSCDSWGVDYVLLHRDDSLFTAPFHYRDARTNDCLDRMLKVVSADEISAETGIQFMEINTLCQLFVDLVNRPLILSSADHFLLIADYFNYLFSGVARSEVSLASTTQLYNPYQQRWSSALIEKFGFPKRIFPEMVSSGTALGPLLPDLAAETGLLHAQVVAGCSHDTGAAVAAVPAGGGKWAYLSSGTWSLLGVESSRPINTALSRRYNFTNEIGYGGTFRFLKNIIGLWIVQECRRWWAKGGEEHTHDELTRMAEASTPLRSFIDPTDVTFVRPDNMPEKVANYCRDTRQPIPASPGEIVRCVFDSLAMSYRRTVDQLEEVTGERISTLHIVGGGAQNKLLNQLSANALGREVIAGPVECTAIGNVIVQAIALGDVPSLISAREIVRTSFPMVRYDPCDIVVWEEGCRRYAQIKKGQS